MVIPYDPAPPRLKESCVACRDEIPPGAQFCGRCKTVQGFTKSCVACRQPIPKAASLCVTCKTEQAWWRRQISISQTTLALLIALAGALATASVSVMNLLDRSSNTSFTMTSADRDNIYIYVSNDGRKASKLAGFRLQLVGVDVEDGILDLVAEDKSKGRSIIRPGDVTIGLTCLGLRALRRDPSKPGRFTKEEIAKRLDTANLKLVVDIKESNGAIHPADELIQAKQLAAFIMHWVPDHDTP